MTRRRHVWAAWLVATLAAGGARQAAAQTLSLAEIEAKAQRDRPELAQRRAEIDRANAELAGVRAKSQPTLGARGELAVAPGGQLVTVEDTDSGDNFFVQGSRSLGQGNEALIPQPRYSAMLIGRWTVLDFGRSSFGERAAQAGISAGRASLISAKVELIRAARSAYLGWLEAHETWQLSHRDAEVTAARTASVRALIDEGVRPRTEATLSAYDEKLARLRESRARRASDVAFDALSATVQSQLPKGATPELAVLELGGGAPKGVGPKPQPAAAGVGVKDPTLDVLQYQHDAALAAARAADKSSAPQIDLAADLGVSGQDSEVFPVYRAAVAITMPLYDGGAQSAVAGQHRAEARGLEARRQLLAEQIRLQRLSAQQALGAAAEDLGLTLELLATAESMLSEAEEHYRAGSDTLERVLSAQRSLVQARREVLSSKLGQARARLEVEPIVIRD
jgi:outer membrane protein, multidrug efflux system